MTSEGEKTSRVFISIRGMDGRRNGGAPQPKLSRQLVKVYALGREREMMMMLHEAVRGSLGFELRRERGSGTVRVENTKLRSHTPSSSVEETEKTEGWAGA